MQQRLQLLAPAVLPYFLRLGGFIVHPRFAQIGQHLVLTGFLSLPRIELGLMKPGFLGEVMNL